MSYVGSRHHRSRRSLTVAVAAVLALLISACSSADQSRTVQTPADPISPSEDASIARSVAEPEDSSVTGEERLAAPQASSVVTGENVVHVLGSIRATPEIVTGWEADIPVVQDDLATAASLSCDLGDSCDPEAIAAWAENRVDLINLATSANVLPVEDLSAMRDALAEVNVATVGFGVSSIAEQPFVFDNGDIAIAFHSLSLLAVPEVSATDDRAGIAGPASFNAVLESVGTSREQGRGVVVMIDWEGLDARAPDASNISAVEALVEAGADAVVGHGSDFLLRFDQVGNGIAAYGLGNALTTTQDPQRRDGSVLRLEFDRPGRSCLLPARGTEEGPALDDPTAADCSN